MLGCLEKGLIMEGSRGGVHRNSAVAAGISHRTVATQTSERKSIGLDLSPLKTRQGTPLDGNATTMHRNVALLSVATTIAPRITTSEDIDRRLQPALKRLRLPKGLLQRVAGVHERRNWDVGQAFDDAAVSAGKRALAEAGIDPSEVGLMINTSVTR